MKKKLVAVSTLAILALFIVLIGVKAQGPVSTAGSQVWFSASGVPACTPINATGATNAAVTLTFPNPGSGTIVIYEIDMDIANTATGAVTQAQVNWTSTNLNSWQKRYSSANAANTSTSFGPFVYQFGLRAVANTVPTIVSPAANTQASYNINACYTIAVP